MDRRTFIAGLGLLPALAAPLGCVAATASDPASRGPRRSARLRRIGVQLYSLRTDARVDLERTLAAIAEIGYDDVELLGSFNNFDMPPARLRAVLDANGLRAPSTHVAGRALDELDRQLDDALTLGHEYLIVAGLPLGENATLDDWRRWADRFNEAGRIARARGVWVGFHNHAGDFRPIDGAVPYDVFIDSTEPEVVRHQLDTGNCAMAGIDPLVYLRRYGRRYWSFHIKDVPALGATRDTELGTGTLDFPALLAAIPDIDSRHLFVEQETYPGAPIDSVRRDYHYLAGLTY
jgi:sugar phosphate isomerase/epimerase